LGVIVASRANLGARWLSVEGIAPLPFTENETNNERLFGAPYARPHGDGFKVECPTGSGRHRGRQQGRDVSHPFLQFLALRVLYERPVAGSTVVHPMTG